MTAPTSPATGPAKGPIYLHVGTPKTGTSYLQDVLFNNRDALAEQGLLYPASRPDGQFLGALDLMRLPWEGLERQAVGTWEALARRAREWEGPVIISHEILATAKPGHIAHALASLGHPEREVRIVVSARDLVRQVPAEWQENVKHMQEISYGRFLEEIADPDRPGRIAPWFWDAQDVPAILSRWAADLPDDRVTVITVPPAGAPRELLWERFVAAFDLGGYRLEPTTQRANPSMGVPESALLRRLNEHTTKLLAPGHYQALVRDLLAHETLALRKGTPRLGVSAATWSWADGIARGWVDRLAERDYLVVGELADLVPAPASDGEYADPDRPDETQVVEAAVDALSVVLEEAARLRDELQALRDRLGPRDPELSFKARQRARAKKLATSKVWGRRAAAAYRNRQL